MRCRTIVQSALTALLGLLLIGSPLAAQGDSASLTGITVTGYGSASAPADQATIILALAESNYGPPTTLQPGATPGASERRAATPAVNALVQAGIAEANIDVIVGPSVDSFGGYGGPASALLRFTIDNPSPEQISEIIDAATVGAADERLLLGRVGVQYKVEDCSPLLREARENALEDAHERASLQAELMDVSLGSITGSRDVRTESDAMILGGPILLSSCAPGAEASNRYAPFNLPTFDPTAPADVLVTMNMDVSFGIEEEMTATPAS